MLHLLKDEPLTSMPYTQSDAPLLRAKGAIGGRRFDVVGDEWATQPDSNSSQTMNVIFASHVPADFLDAVRSMVDQAAPIVITADKKAVVKSISSLPISERVEIINDRIAQYPQPISLQHGGIIPDCEADEGYEIAFWGNEDDVPSEAKHAAMTAYIAFRLKGLHELEHHRDTVTDADQKAAYWKRRYGATLGYNGYFLAEYIPSNLLKAIREANPAQMLCDELLALDHLTFDEGRAEEKPEFVANVMKAACEHGDLTQDQAQTLKNYMLQLASANEDFAARWGSAMSFVDDI